MGEYLFESHKILCIGILTEKSLLLSYPNLYIFPSIYRNVHGIEKYWRKINEHFPLIKHKDKWYSDWKYLVKDVDTVILSDGIRGRDVVEYIHKQNSNARIIIYYCNPNFSHGRNEPSKYKDLPCELVTFDIKNAQDYKIKFRHFYYPYMKQRLYTIDNDFKQDIFFIGEDKGRLDKILEWKKIFNHYGLSCKFYILKTKHRVYFSNHDELIDEKIPYEEIIKEIRHSRAILDFVQDKQHGITLRPMEAMCFQKKLITNFEEITQYNFYNQNNVFRLGYDNLKDLKNFLYTPYEKIDDSIRMEYVPENWLDTFFEETL